MISSCFVPSPRLLAIDSPREISYSGHNVVKSNVVNPFAAPSSARSTITSTAHHGTPFSEVETYPTPWAEIADTLPHGLVILNRRQELSHENAFCKKLAGYSIVDKGGFQEWLASLCPDPAYLERMTALWQERIWRNQLPLTLTLKVGDGRLRELEFRSSLLEDGGIVIMIEDATELHRLEKIERSDKSIFQTLFLRIPFAVIRTNPDQLVIDANPSFLTLTGSSLSDLRRKKLGDLIPSAALQSLDRPPELAESGDALECETTLQATDGSKVVRVLALSIRFGVGETPLSHLYFFVPEDKTRDMESQIASLRMRLGTLSGKAQALLQVIPDLILLIDSEGVIIDCAPPSKSWEEISPDTTWQGRTITDAWPALAALLERCREKVVSGNRIITADIRGRGKNEFEIAVTLTLCGEDQILVLARNQSQLRSLRETDSWQGPAFLRSPMPTLHLDAEGYVSHSNSAAASLFDADRQGILGRKFSETTLPGGTVAEFIALEESGKPTGSLAFLRPLNRTPEPPKVIEIHGLHHFRNQLQLLTSLFSLEPQGAEARDAFLKWQIRLRSLAQACPAASSDSLRICAMLRNLADDICSLLSRGPGRRCVIVSGDEDAAISLRIATPFGLLMGELIHLVLSEKKFAPGPDLFLDLHPDLDEGFRLKVRLGTDREFAFSDRHAEIETLQLLVEQIHGSLEVVDPARPSQEWELVVPGRKR